MPPNTRRALCAESRNPEPDIDGDVQGEDLLAAPVYTHDIEQAPLCGGKTWTWDGQLVRTD